MQSNKKALLSTAKNLRNLALSDIRVAQRDYRLSEIRKIMESIIPELVQQQRDPSNRTFGQKEQRLLEQVIQIGITFAENGKSLSPVNNQLADMITTLGYILQGVDI